MGWPPLIPINCEGQRTRLMVNFKAWVPMVRPYLSTLKYTNYKKEAHPDVHVRVFNATIRINGKTSKQYKINAFSYTLRKMALNWCHNYVSQFPSYSFSKLTQAFYKGHRKTQNDNRST